MNQRPAKTHRAAPGQDGRVTLNEVIAFFESAETVLEREDQGDAAFYFGQVADHLRKDPHKGFNETVTRILGL